MSMALLLEDSRKLLFQIGIVEGLERYSELFARDRALAAQEQKKKHILFLCGHNAGRSQMSAAWFNHTIEQRIKSGNLPRAFSAGTSPSSRVNPEAVIAMKEVGVDMSNTFPKPCTKEIIESVFMVISMGCGDKIDKTPNTIFRDWPLKDPHGKGIETVRQIRDDIIPLVDKLIEEVCNIR